MPRLRQVPRVETTDEFVLSWYDRIFAAGRDPVAHPGTSRGTPGTWWTVFALVPDVFRHAVDGFQLIADPRRRIDPCVRELGQTRAGWARGSQWVFSQHCKMCRSLGMSEEKIASIPAWQVSDCFGPLERAVLAYTDDLVLGGGRVADATFAVLQQHLSDEEILEFTYIITMYDMLSVTARALRLEFDDRDDVVVEVPAG